MTDKLKNQQRRFMLYNLIAFTLIFVLFAGIVYSQIEQTLIGSVRDELANAKENINAVADYIDHQLALFRFVEIIPGESAPKRREDNVTYSPAFGSEVIIRTRPAISTRIQVIIRSADGTILNPHAMGRIYFEGYLAEVSFSPTYLDQIERLGLSDGSTYLTTAFTKVQGGTVYFVQLLANVDGEQAIVDNFRQLLAACVAVCVVLSLSASYILSRTTMAPVITAWRRQSEFVENASHELRTPLTILQGKMEGLLTTPDATVMDRADDIAVALSETQRLVKLTADLMTLARADADEALLEKTDFDLDALLGELTEPYREMAEADGKTLTLDLGLPGRLNADRGRIHELMVILLDNALKYTRPGDRITLVTRPGEGGALIEVRDTGVGMSEEAIRRAFDRFYREEKARTREKGGSGLGLSIAKWIVDSHGGSITIHPGEEGGISIRVVIK